MRNNLYFSLVVPTINRSIELQSLLDSLKLQTYKDFEVIIIDQNKDNRVHRIIEPYRKSLNIIYFRSFDKGLSINRNIGIKLAKGQIISFPDDDCTYEYDTLEKVHSFFLNFPEFQIYSCAVKDKKQNKRFPMAKKDSMLKPYNYFDKSISIGIFISLKKKSDVVFDNQMGVGSFFGSGEESDLLSSLLNLGYRGKYFANEYVYHEFPSQNPSKTRYLQYGKGYGALMKKEIILRKKYYFIIPFIVQIIARFLLSILPTNKRKLFYYSLEGRLKGFFNYKITK